MGAAWHRFGVHRRQGLGRPDQPPALSAQGLDHWGPSAGMQVSQALRLTGTTKSQTEKALVPATEHAACALWAREAPGPREPPASPNPLRMRLQVWVGGVGGMAVGESRVRWPGGTAGR